MQEKLKKSSRLSFLVGLCVFALSLGLQAPAANAQDTGSQSAAPAQPQAAQKSAKRYFVEFRSRSALSYGHTFLVHGKLNAKGEVGQVTAKQVAGLHPFTESSVPWMIGHLIPVVSETGASDGDTEDEYITARYRVLLTEAEYAKASAYIAEHKKNSPLWHAVLYNCNAWVGSVAKFMELKTPASTMLYPEDYIKELASLNGGQMRPLRRQQASRPAVQGAQRAAAAPSAQPQTEKIP